MTAPGVLAIGAAGTALVLRRRPDGLPEVLHWGPALAGGDAAYDRLPVVLGPPTSHSALDEPGVLTVLPGQAEGYAGTPGWEGHIDGGSAAARWSRATVEREGATLRTTATSTTGLLLTMSHALDEHGVLRVDAEVTNVDTEADAPVDVAALRALLPLPRRATDVLDLTGRWCRERSPQRSALQHGTHLRTGRRGRTGHDATLLMVAGTPGFDFRHGEVWAAHVAWSGNHEHLVERLPEGAGPHAAVIGGGEALDAGEIRLGAGETYRAPTVVFVQSVDGLDGLSTRLYRSLRSRTTHPSRPRPVVLNTWEAVFFDTDLDHLKRLADTAARIGVERFVLDDGWFGQRRSDRAGLGDWIVSADVWPRGLHPLVDHVKGLGLEFGLWVEPEMVSDDSDLVRAHPDWVLGPAAGPPRTWRFQQVVDLANPDAWAHILEQLSALVREYGIDYLKWDHNRDLLEAVRTSDGVVDRPAVHAQTIALYDLLDELRRRHPGLEIESCASGGARIDLGILERTDRVWTSDCNDALERALIQRWTGLLLPPELVGAHIGPPMAHTTHRVLDLGLRTLVALQGHAGLEWDITTCDDLELDALAAWIGVYRELRDLLHTGDPARGTADDGALLVNGTVSADQTHAAYGVVRLATGLASVPGLVRLPGLDPEATYAVRLRPEGGAPVLMELRPPSWWTQAVDGSLHVPGSVLSDVGLSMPVLNPAQGFLLEVRAVGSAQEAR